MIGMAIGGLDPSGGAGLLADIKTFQNIGIYGAGVITALTCQNPYKISTIKSVDVNFIEEEIDSVLSVYNNIEYVKTGMLYSKDIIKVVSKKIKEYKLKAVVDPVFVATTGKKLTNEDIINPLKKYLLPKAIFTTPNISEAEQLTGMKITTEEEAIKASKTLGKISNNIITGGHFDGLNIININEEIIIKKQKLIKTSNLHGTGCVFSSAIVAYLIKENDLEISCLKALDYVFNSVKNGNYGTLIHKI